MEAFIARAAGEKPPGRGYMGCPGLNSKDTSNVSLNVNTVVFVLTECRFYSQPSQRMCDLSHSSRRHGVTGGVRAPGYTCSTGQGSICQSTRLQKDLSLNVYMEIDAVLCTCVRRETR